MRRMNWHRGSLNVAVVIVSLSSVGCSHSRPDQAPIKNIDTVVTASKTEKSPEPCSAKSLDGETCFVRLADVRPTQFCVGYRDVQRKKATIESSRKEKNQPLRGFFKNPGLIVKGPEDIYYLVDGHHRARALLESGVLDFECKIIADYSQLSMADFWQKMIDQKMVWPYDAHGHGPQSPLNIPTNLSELADDPYRTLAEDAQDRGANKKIDLLFQEFYWANFYRSRIDPSLVANDYDKAIEEALKLAKTTAASSLPGYGGP
jgi:hypothetical protein